MCEGTVHPDLLSREIGRVHLGQEEVLTSKIHGSVKPVWCAANSPLLLLIAVAVIVNSSQESVS